MCGSVGMGGWERTYGSVVSMHAMQKVSWSMPQNCSWMSAARSFVVVQPAPVSEAEAAAAPAGHHAVVLRHLAAAYGGGLQHDGRRALPLLQRQLLVALGRLCLEAAQRRLPARARCIGVEWGGGGEGVRGQAHLRE